MKQQPLFYEILPGSERILYSKIREDVLYYTKGCRERSNLQGSMICTGKDVAK